MDEKTLSILLKMGVDEASAKKALAQFTVYQKEINELTARAEVLKKALAKAIDQKENTDELSKELIVVGAALARVKKASDDALIDGFKTDAERATEAAKKFNDQLKEAQKSAFLLRDVGEKLQQVGGRLSSAGQSILNPLMSAQDAYMQAQQAQASMDATAQRWSQAQQEIDQARIRIGAATTQELLPMLEAVADLTTQIADLLEQNPELVKLAAGAGITLAAGGALLQTVGSIASLAGMLKGVGGAGGVGAGAAGTAGVLGKTLGTVALYASAVYIGAELGAELGNYLGEQIYKDQWEQKGLGDAWETFKQINTMFSGIGLAAQALQAAGFDEQAAKVWDLAKSLNGLGDAADGANQDKRPAMPSITADQLAAFDAYQQAVTAREQFEQQSEQARTQIVQAAGAERVALEAAYEAQRSQVLADFARSQARLEEDYYRQRSIAVRNYNKQTQRAEEDHQRQMARMRREHLERVDDLERSRDALGLVKEQRDYEQARDDAEEDYQVAARRRSEDWADQLQQMDENFQIQDARRQEDFDIRLQQMDAAHAAELAKLTQQTEAKLKVFDEQNKKELEMLLANETSRLNALRQAALNDQSATQNAAARLTAQYKAWLERNMASLAVPRTYYGGGRASGGYVYDDAFYRMAEGNRKEFVLNNQATLAAERMVGGPLNQDSFLRAMAGDNAGRRAGSSRVALNQRISFHGSFSDGEKAAMRKMSEQAAETALYRMIGDD